MVKEKKVAVVTGGGSGMGQAAATRLAELGMRVCLFDIDIKKMETIKKEIENNRGEAMMVQCDVTKPEQVEEGFKRVLNQWNRLDSLFANAGIAGALSSIESMDIEEWDQTIATNLNGVFATVKYAIPHLKEHGGSIVITSSVSGNRVFSQAGFSAYSTTKAAQVAFMKMVALELAKYKIRVNAICPGGIQTNIGKSIHKEPELADVRIPVKFPEGDQPLEHGAGSIDQIADLVQFLVLNESSHISGTEIYIDGGESLLRG